MAIKKTTSKQKMGPLGNPLGNPLGFFNSLKGKTKPEPKQTLKKAQYGIFTNTTQGPVISNEYKPPYPGYESPERITEDKRIYEGPLNKSESIAVSKGMMSPAMQNYMRRPDQSKYSETVNEKKKGGSVKYKKK